MIVPILIVGFILRLVLINQSLWLDESIGVMAIRNLSVGEILNYFSPGNFHPPFYYLVAKGWGNIFGFNEISIRMVSVIAGVISIYGVYKICLNIKIYSKKVINILGLKLDVAQVSALLLAINPLHIYYSQDAWVYSLSTMFAVLTILQYQKLVDCPNRINVVLFALTSSLSIYTYYPLVFMLLAIAVHALCFKKSVKYVLISYLFVAVSFIPWLPIFHKQLNVAAVAQRNLPLWWKVLGKTSIKSLMLVWVKFLIGKISFYTKYGYLAFVATISVSPLFSLSRAWTAKRHLSIIWIWVVIPLIVSILAGIFGSGFSYFRLIFILPALLALIAFGAFQLGSFALSMIVLGSLTSLVIFWINPRFHRENWGDAVRYIESTQSTPKTISIFINYSQTSPYRYYSRKIPVYSAKDWKSKGASHVWLFRYVQPIFDPEDELRKEIEKNGFTKLQERDFNGVTIWEYKNNK